jgi:hypothetical protein
MLTPDKLRAEMEQARKSRERSKTRKFFIGLGWLVAFIAIGLSAMYLGRSAADWVGGS